jgi:hypothetical protein
MRLPSSVVFLGIILVGAMVLAPLVAMLDITPLPGDVRFNWGNQPIFLPFTQSAIASLALALLFRLARR